MKYRLSLKSQLIVIILAVTSFSTMLAFTFSIIKEYHNSRNDLKNNMLFTAQLISENCKSTLLFNDSLGAHELLSSFSAIPMVFEATIFSFDNNRFASFTQNSLLSEPVYKSIEKAVYFDKIGLHICQPIFQDSKKFGTLTLHISTKFIDHDFEVTIIVFLVVFLMIMLISYYLAMKLQKIISGPILSLKDLAEQITNKSDYSIRVPHTHDNEIGLLQKSFDTMVCQLDKNIASLKNEIHDRIVSQHEAQQLRLYLKNIIDSLSSVIIAVDPDGRIKQLNLEAQKYLNLSNDNALHQPVFDTLSLLKGKEDLFIKCREEGKPQRFPVVENSTAKLQQKYLNVAIYPLSQSEDQGVVIHIDDVTDKTRMEMMMIQNEKMMSLGGLAAGMAHEINNPLGIISQGVLNIIRHISPDFAKNQVVANDCGINFESLQKYLEQRKVQHYLEGVLAAAKRASSIVANMLQFSRMSNQSKTDADIRQVVDQTIELAYNEYELKKNFDFRLINIQREFDDFVPSLFCNVTEIQQVILNLLKNAAHALYNRPAPCDEPKITIRIKNEGKHIRINVEDNGPGIPEEYKKRIFEPFFTTKEVGVGTGLGLSVSFFIIAKNHSGSIEFESTIGAGTRFIIRIPLTK